MTSGNYTLANLVADTGGVRPQTVIIYGPPDSGKTTLAAKLSETHNLVWVDLDRGFQAAINVIPMHRYGNVIPIFVDDNSKEANGVRTVTRLVEDATDKKVCVKHGKVSCIPCTRDKEQIQTINLYKTDTNTIFVVDSLTRLADSALAHALGPLDIDKRKKAEFDHWDAQGLLLRNIMKQAKQLPCHTIFISHEEEISLPDGTKRIVPIGGTRANSRRIAQFADHTIYCQVKNRQHIAYSKTTSIPRITAGSNNNIALEDGDSILDIFKPKEITDELASSLKFATDDNPHQSEVDEETESDSPEVSTVATASKATSSLQERLNRGR